MRLCFLPDQLQQAVRNSLYIEEETAGQVMSQWQSRFEEAFH